MAVKERYNEQEVKDQMTSRFQNSSGQAASNSVYGNVLSRALSGYERKYNRKMPESVQTVLVNSFKQQTDRLMNSHSREAIHSALADVSQVDNPITLAYNLMSVLIPNFTYTEFIGIQPLPTKTSPIFYPQITANETRNNIEKTTSLLGATNWCDSNTFTTNRIRRSSGVGSIAGDVWTFTAEQGSITPGSLSLLVTLSPGVVGYVFDDSAGNLSVVPHLTKNINGSSGTVNYKTGLVTLNLLAAGTDTEVVPEYRYDFSDDTKPAQAVLEWITKPIRAEPYRVRTTYNMDDFFQVKQVLNDYNIDTVLSTSVAGLINKEISGSVFDDALLRTDATYPWEATDPTGVAWALHRLSLIQTFVRAGNGIRQNVARSGGNVVVAGTEWMNFIETLGDDLWKPQGYGKEEPIGPYVAGTLCDKFKVIKNQDYPDDTAVMGYKRDDVDASMIGGVFIGLYCTNPINLDDLKTIQAMGTQFGWTKAFDNSLVELKIVK